MCLFLRQSLDNPQRWCVLLLQLNCILLFGTVAKQTQQLVHVYFAACALFCCGPSLSNPHSWYMLLLQLVVGFRDSRSATHTIGTCCFCSVCMFLRQSLGALFWRQSLSNPHSLYMLLLQLVLGFRDSSYGTHTAGACCFW